jgi:hypothetical protein
MALRTAGAISAIPSGRIIPLGFIGFGNGDSGWTTHPVGQKLANPWGLYDMHGNVLEWCQDWFDWSLPGGIAVDPQGPATGSLRVFRGGCWLLWRCWEFGGRYCRSAIRYGRDPGDRYLVLRFPSCPGPRSTLSGYGKRSCPEQA